MPRIAGVDLPENKPTWIALTTLFGVGRRNVVEICQKAQISLTKRAQELTGEEITRLTRVLSDYKIEGDLRREIGENIKRLREIGSYRGARHTHGLPARGQRTRTNARTKRGKRVTIGALKKETMAAKTQQQTAEAKKTTK